VLGRFLKTQSCNRFVEAEDFVLFKCWSRDDALQYEYLLQLNMQREGGIFVEEFIDRCNKQLIQKPRRNKAQQEPEASYVYARLTRVEFVWRDKREKPPKDNEEPPAKFMKLSTPPLAASSQAAGPPEVAPSPAVHTIPSSSSESDSEGAAPVNEVVIPESNSVVFRDGKWRRK